MPLNDLTEFLRLSAFLNYNLSATSLNRYNVLMFIISDKAIHPDEDANRDHKSIIMEALHYLFDAYSKKRRRLGPKAILHPLRATALYSMTFEELSLIDILSILLHDVPEDISPKTYDSIKWKRMEERIDALFDRLDPETEEELLWRLDSLTKRDHDSYYSYIARLLERSQNIPQIVQIKLADRLDNTLDMRIDIRDPIEGVDFYKTIFELLFLNNYRDADTRVRHHQSTSMNGARRLYQLFKNIVLLSLVRQNHLTGSGDLSSALFNNIARASLKEAQRGFIQLAGNNIKDLRKRRGLVLETMEYCFSGRTGLATKPDPSSMIDGLFSDYFGHKDRVIRHQQIDSLYHNKELMFQTCIAFIVIFISFLNDPDFYVRGIDSEGIHPS